MSKAIGLFGFGEVAKGFYQTLQSNNHLDAYIKCICIKNEEKVRTLDQSLFTSNAADILNDPAIDIVIELINDAEAAYSIVKTALTNGKSVISANKKMLAEHMEEVSQWHQKFPGTLLYEGAVGGSIPILHNLEQFFKHQEISQLRGILNGSTNYILTMMREHGLTFNDALALAQEKGFAESDPELDLSGKDALYKLIILTHHAFGETVADLTNVRLESITNMEAQFYELAKAQGLKIKSIATATKKDNKTIIKVQPELVSPSDELYGIEHEFNAVVIDASYSGRQVFVGKGAGSLPTGSAIINDLSLLLNGFRYQPKAGITDLNKSA